MKHSHRLWLQGLLRGFNFNWITPLFFCTWESSRWGDWHWCTIFSRWKWLIRHNGRTKLPQFVWIVGREYFALIKHYQSLPWSGERARAQITPPLQPEDVPLMKSCNTYVLCSQNLAICVKCEWVTRQRARGSLCLSETRSKHNQHRLWGSSLSSLTLISAALVRRWSDEASAQMNNAETPAK